MFPECSAAPILLSLIGWWDDQMDIPNNAEAQNKPSGLRDKYKPNSVWPKNTFFMVGHGEGSLFLATIGGQLELLVPTSSHIVF